MTHAELTRDAPGGFASDCPGELFAYDRIPDVVYSASRPATRAVILWSCGRCGFRISECGGVTLNSYRPSVLSRAGPAGKVSD